MESNIKGLVAAGHEMASELKAECGAVDMRSVAKLISDLATQLEVQLVRANALAEDQQKAIESIKQADSAVKLAHEKFSALAAENAGLKSGAMDEIKVINRGGQAYCVKDGVQVNPMYARGWNDYRAKSLQSPPQPPMLSWLKLNAKQSASSLTALNTSCVTSCHHMTPKRCLRLCVFFWKNREVSKNDNHKTTSRKNHISP